MKMHKETWHCM